MVHVQQELNLEKLNRMFMELMTRPTPGANNPAQLIPRPMKTSSGAKKIHSGPNKVITVTPEGLI